MPRKLEYYNSLLQQARTATDVAKAAVAEEFVPKMYDELTKNQGYEPIDARNKIERDCVMWESETILRWLPDEVKNGKKAENGRKGAKAKNEKLMNEVKYWVLGNHWTFGRINEAFMASTDSNFRMGISANHVFIRAEPVTPKSEAPEPVTVQPVSSAPIKAK